MEILISIAHILGSVIALFILGLLGMFIAGWEAGMVQKQAIEEASVSLGVSVEALDKEENAPKVLQLSAEKFSTELFRNRISDFCGLIRTMWGWLGNLIQGLVLLAVVWYTVIDNMENAVYAWFVVGIAITFWVASVVFSIICKLLTGRYPGQAKEARKVAAEWVKNNRKLFES